MASVVNVSEPGGPERSPEWARRYPPLVTLIVALALAIIVLPSSLNLPQANPSTTLELAPVPPTDETPPPVGNISELSLGVSSSVESGGALGEGLGFDDLPPPLDDALTGRKRSLQTKRCVGRPPRQTEDPLSPPCVAFFEGDNGGATYQGVTEDEIRVLFYEDGASVTFPTARGTDNYPANTLIDLSEPARPNEVGQFFTRRNWMRYFEDRFQLYGRKPRFFIYYGGGTSSSTPEGRQADAAQAYAMVKPFATISTTGLTGGSDAFLEFMAQRGVLNFGSLSGRSEDFFNQFPKLIWGYPPSVEQMGRNYVSAVCQKLVGQPVAFSGNFNGQARRFGLIVTSDPRYPTLQKLGKLVEDGVKACGGNIVARRTFPTNGYHVDASTPKGYASTNMLNFSQAGVTTVLWAGGYENDMSKQAAILNYRPEWVVLGDGLPEANNYGQAQDQTVWRHAWTLTPTVKVVPLRERVCYQAYREVDQTAADSDVANFACDDYDNLRQLFTGIQVAGPRLGPFSIDKGFHAIPAIESPDPRLPACYYEPADYTCVKDMQAMWYDPTSVAAGAGQAGCWKMAQGGKRYRRGTWPEGNLNTMRSGGDACNLYTQTEYILY